MRIKPERLRVAFLGSFLVDYTIKIAMPMLAHANVLVLVDDRALARDVVDEDVTALRAAGGQINTFRQARIWNRWWSIVRVSWLLLWFRPHVVVAHEHVHPHLACIMRMIASFSKLLLIVHDPRPHVGRDAAFAEKNRRNTLIERNCASAFAVHGEFCANSLSEQLEARDTRPIYSIAMGPNFSPTEVPVLRRSRRILMFGRMEMYKGLQLLLQASQRLKARGVDFHLRLAGSGLELDRLADQFKALTCCSIESRYISRLEALEEFAAADLLVAPYLEATQSGVVALAFASGRPVVATAVGGLADFVKHGVNGILVQPNDPEKLADALQVILSDPGTLATLAHGARMSSAGDHSWDSISRSLFDAVKAIAS